MIMVIHKYSFNFQNYCSRETLSLGTLTFIFMIYLGVIGVAELCNKINGRYFTQFDEEIASTFSVYCAICIMHV